jgi:hypothetical protein
MKSSVSWDVNAIVHSVGFEVLTAVVMKSSISWDIKAIVHFVGFEVLTAVVMKSSVSWDVNAIVHFVGFEVLTAVVMKSSLLRDIVPCNPSQVYNTELAITGDCQFVRGRSRYSWGMRRKSHRISASKCRPSRLTAPLIRTLVNSDTKLKLVSISWDPTDEVCRVLYVV